jgi:tetratricopeptide (TPR) repeat protein
MELHNLDEVISIAKRDFHKGNYKKAIEGFTFAKKIFQENNDPLNAAEMANNLSVAYLQARKPKEALEIVLGTDTVFEAHKEKSKQAMALGNLGAAYHALKDFDRAETAYSKSAELFHETGEKDLRSHVLKSLTALQIRKGNQIGSIFTMQASLDAKEHLTLKDRILKFVLKIPQKLFG